MKSRRTWTQKEDQGIRKLVNQSKCLNWAFIAKKMVNQFGFKKRTGKQCRQRWFNHLVPGIQKKTWDQSQQQHLLSLHRQYGNKWTIIAQHLPGRTDNSIKNYFYSTIRRSLRRMGKITGSKNSTSLLRQIKPSILTRIFSNKNDEQIQSFQAFQAQCQKFQIYNLTQLFQKIRNDIIHFSSFKPHLKNLFSQQQKIQYRQIFDLIIKLNRIYQSMKRQQKIQKNKENNFKKDFQIMMNQQSQQQEEPQSLSIQEFQRQKYISNEQNDLGRKTKEIKFEMIGQGYTGQEQKMLQTKIEINQDKFLDNIKQSKVIDMQSKKTNFILVQNILNNHEKSQFIQVYDQDPFYHIQIPQQDPYQYSKSYNNMINISPSFNRYHSINFIVSPMAYKNPFTKNLYQELYMSPNKQKNNTKSLEPQQQVQQQN